LRGSAEIITRARIAVSPDEGKKKTELPHPAIIPESSRFGLVALAVTLLSLLRQLLVACISCEGKTLTFSGYDWTVKSGTNIGPGPNDWDASKR
jgi:hypothetical protein